MQPCKMYERPLNSDNVYFSNKKSFAPLRTEERNIDKLGIGFDFSRAPNINSTFVSSYIDLLVIPILLKCHIIDPCTFTLLIIVAASHYTTMLSSHYSNNNICLYSATSIIVRGASKHITIKRHKKIYVYNKTNTSVLK